MKDNVVKLGYYAYMLRVDILDDFSSAIKLFHEWKNKYACVYYIVGQEVSKLGKKHLQSIVWFETEINDKPKLRNWWLKRSAKTKQAVAFTSAKKVQNLAKYSKKDDNYITNLHEEELKKIGKWETPEKLRKNWSEKLENYATGITKEVKQYGLDQSEIKRQVLISILEFYRKNKRRPHRTTIQYLVWKLELNENPDYSLLQDWNLL